ncbi:4-(cytidine 5'-diphospho)-2-C-methyl-D-erythritol kinase [Pseudomonadota bacterium]
MEVFKNPFITYKSYGKLNLFLEIVGVNQHKYHLLNSYFSFVDLFDLMTFVKMDNPNFGVELVINGEKISSERAEENIILKAIRTIEEMFNFKCNFKIELEKNIPIGGGMGGGSSNCATTLKFLNKHYNLGLDKQKLIDIGVSLGVDVPFFINSKSCFVSGIGEKFEEIENNELNNLYVLVVNPKVEVWTKEVFELYDEEHAGEFLKFVKYNKAESSLIDFIKSRKNDLQEFAIEIAPEIKELVATIQSSKDCIFGRMSGSGSTCFGVFKNKEDAKNCMDKILEKKPHYFAVIIRFLDRVQN